MNKPTYCTILPTSDLGFDKAINRYYILFNVYIHHLQKSFIVNCGCDDYDEIEDNMTNFTIEFLTYADLNNIEVAYDKMLFEQLEHAAKDVFGDLKFEERTGVSV